MHLRCLGGKDKYGNFANEMPYTGLPSNEPIRPFNFNKYAEHVKETLDFNFGDPKKIVMIGDQLTTDILFGNLNEMATIWLFKYKDICDDVEHRCPDLFKLEEKEADKVFKEESKFHEGLNTDL